MALFYDTNGSQQISILGGKGLKFAPCQTRVKIWKVVVAVVVVPPWAWCLLSFLLEESQNVER
jgi:hypothetical protein